MTATTALLLPHTLVYALKQAQDALHAPFIESCKPTPTQLWRACCRLSSTLATRHHAVPMIMAVITADHAAFGTGEQAASEHTAACWLEHTQSHRQSLHSPLSLCADRGAGSQTPPTPPRTGVPCRHTARPTAPQSYKETAPKLVQRTTTTGDNTAVETATPHPNMGCVSLTTSPHAMVHIHICGLTLHAAIDPSAHEQ